MLKKKIALAVPSFSGGGAERVMVILANKFIEWGFPVDFIVVSDKGPYKELLSNKANKIVLAKKSKSRTINKFIVPKRLLQYFKKNDDIVFMSTIRDLNIFVKLIGFCSKAKCKIILREAASLDKSHFYGSIKNRLKLFLMKYTYKSADNVISNSNATKVDLISFLGLDEKKIISIYNPMILKNIERENKKTIKIVAAGRLVSNKNFIDLIKVFPLLKEKYPTIELDILGEGPEKENLQKLIDELGLESSVKLVGFVDNPYQYYAASNVFVQTSLWEGFGYVLAEAMSCGTPVVAYDSKGAMREILANGKYGALTPVGDLPALADAIIQQIEKPTSSALLAEAVQRFDVDIIAKQYLSAMGLNYE